MLYRCLPLLTAIIVTCTPSLLLAQQQQQLQSVTKPNIVILLADDLGWGDVGYHNSDVVTPNIDTIARSGVAFDRFYVNPTCSPTRASLLTGQFSTTHGVNGPIQWHSKQGLPLEWPTLPGFLKQAGFQTHLVGKWHLGNADTAYWPQQRGFDSFYGHLNGGIGYFDHIFSGGVDWQKDGVTLREQGYTTDLIRDAAIELIENRSQDDEPLFLFVSFNAIHTPIEEPDTPDKAHQGRVTLLRMISSLDQAIGEILESVNQQPWGQDTIIVFASDNGGSPPKPWWVELLIPPMRDGFSSNGRLKQGKGSVFEGGIRVPAAIWWPGKIASAQAFSEVVHVADILPTLADFV
ncbi:MAG: sulfatase-like hydrolase/transferase, partial [Pseudomonadota bacterium]|nr:sulfatase-like hydrolase/transferase [Pseudomonadota bacterium]